MNGIDYFADTNCFVYLLEENPIIAPFLESSWAYSYITELELLSKKGIRKEQELIFKNVLGTCLKIQHQQEISELTIRIRRTYGLKLPDAIIAATALFHKTPILTADKEFAKVRELDSIILNLK